MPEITDDITDLLEVERVPLDDAASCAALLRFNRPEQLNAMGWDTVKALEKAVLEAAADANVRVVLITGKGRAFSAGGDIKKYMALQTDPVAFPKFVDQFSRTLDTIRRMPKPVLALVNGVCVAGGLELVLACDFAWAAKSARIGDGHLNFAQIGGAGAMTRLPRLIGPARARELVFSGGLLSAEKALEWGLVNSVLPDEELIPAGIAFAREVAAKSPTAVAFTKEVIGAGLATDLESALRLERERALLYCLTLPDSMEGINAFVEKRKPLYPRLS